MKPLSPSFRHAVLATSILTTIPTQADLLLYEGFDYTESEELNTQNGGLGWAGAWATAITTTGASDSIHTIGPGLTFSNLDIVGGSTERSIRNGRSAATRTISAASTTALTADNSTIWFSVLMDPTINIAVGGGQFGNTYATLVFGNESLTDASIGEVVPQTGARDLLMK